MRTKEAIEIKAYLLWKARSNLTRTDPEWSETDGMLEQTPNAGASERTFDAPAQS